jgi:hypothetical protein
MRPRLCAAFLDPLAPIVGPHPKANPMTTTFRTHDGRTLEQAASDLVQREVLCCMSSMVATLANSAHRVPHVDHDDTALAGLTQQAFELSAPVLDYEDAAREAGWVWCAKSEAWTHDCEEEAYFSDAEDLCEARHLDPYEWEVFEHWAVSTWLAEKLQAAGERVDTDFAGLNVWARTTTGQAISIDAVIERITREMHAA